MKRRVEVGKTPKSLKNRENAKMAKVYVALDYGMAEQALSMADKLLPINPYFKVGLELFMAEGPGFLSELSSKGAKIFLDLKFHDIPNTVAGAVRSVVRLQPDVINVHCGGGEEMMRAAAVACKEESHRLGVSPPKVIGVTVLTSLDDLAISQIGFPRSASQQTKHFMDLAINAGLDGVVCSGQDLALLNVLAPKGFESMVPGIRSAGDILNDQKRTLSPGEAVRLGANNLVIGRPITQAKDPVEALQNVLKEIAAK